MAEQIAFMHQSGSIPGIPGVFPGGCTVRYDDHTREVLEVKPFGFVETPAQEDKPESADENATQPLESPVVETLPEPAQVEEPPAPTQTFVNGG